MGQRHAVVSCLVPTLELARRGRPCLTFHVAQFHPLRGSRRSAVAAQAAHNLGIPVPDGLHPRRERDTAAGASSVVPQAHAFDAGPATGGHVESLTRQSRLSRPNGDRPNACHGTPTGGPLCGVGQRAALALAEQVTQIHSPAAHSAPADALTAEQASAVAWLAVVMNAWNRVAITSHYPVGP